MTTMMKCLSAACHFIGPAPEPVALPKEDQPFWLKVPKTPPTMRMQCPACSGYLRRATTQEITEMVEGAAA